MINLPRFNNYKEFLEYYQNSVILLEELTIEVEEIEDYIRGNDEYLVSASKKYIKKKDRELSKGKINTFKYYDDLNNQKFKYVNYLLEEFSYSLIYMLYSELICDTIRMGDIISGMCGSKDLSPEVVDEINNQIFKHYQLTLSKEI